MMMRRREDLENTDAAPTAVDIWANRHAKTIIGVIVYSLTAWFALTAKVEQKVDAVTFAKYVTHTDSLLNSLLTEIREMRQEQAVTHKYLCRGKEESMGCMFP